MIKSAYWNALDNEPGLPSQRNMEERDAITVLRETMSNLVGVERDAAGLKQALATIARVEQACARISIRNMMIAGKIIAAAALKRTESRGGHFRSDFPETDPAQARRSFTTLSEVETIAKAACEETASA